MSSNHHIGNSADSARRITLEDIEKLLSDCSERMNALGVIFDRFQHHACAMVDADLAELSQRDLAGLATAGSCVVSVMFFDIERWQDRTNAIETELDDKAAAQLGAIAKAEGISREEMASQLASDELRRLMKFKLN